VVINKYVDFFIRQLFTKKNLVIKKIIVIFVEQLLFFDKLNNNFKIMETLSFILGVSSVVGIVISILTVVGYIKVGKVKKNLESFQNNISNELDIRTKDIHDSMSRANDTLHQRIDNTERDVLSQLDSRLDKLENKIKNSQKDVLHS
jgi:predicted PurR-regulated permease PerM